MQLVASRFQGLFEWSPCSKTNTIQTMMKWLWLRLVIHVIVPKLTLDLLFAVSKAADSPKEVTSALRGWEWLLNLLYPPELSWKVSRKYRIYDWQCSTSLSLARHWSGSGRIITPIMDSRKICYFFNPRDVCVKDLKCENRGATCLAFTSPFRAQHYAMIRLCFFVQCFMAGDSRTSSLWGSEMPQNHQMFCPQTSLHARKNLSFH